MGESRFTGTLTIGAGDVTDASIASSANIDADKMEHIFQAGTCFNTVIGTAPSSSEYIVFTATTAGVIRGFHALLNDTGTSTDIDFNAKKNGTTVLSSDVTVTHSDSDKQVKDGTLSTTTYSAGDVFSIQCTVTSSTGAQGAYGYLMLQEGAGT